MISVYKLCCKGCNKALAELTKNDRTDLPFDPNGRDIYWCGQCANDEAIQAKYRKPPKVKSLLELIAMQEKLQADIEILKKLNDGIIEGNL